MLIIFYAAISVCFFLFRVERSKWREYYSTLLSASYLRFLEQYVLVYILKVWEYENLPTPLAKIIGVPILLDVTLFPVLGYLIVHYMKEKRAAKKYFLPAAILTIVEGTMVWSGMLEHHRYWNFVYSYFLALATVIFLHYQYKLFMLRRKNVLHNG
ncbi:CBO0543 family protein [Ammoniphilus sp. 3BR4]